MFEQRVNQFKCVHGYIDGIDSPVPYAYEESPLARYRFIEACSAGPEPFGRLFVEHWTAAKRPPDTGGISMSYPRNIRIVDPLDDVLVDSYHTGLTAIAERRRNKQCQPSAAQRRAVIAYMRGTAPAWPSYETGLSYR